MQNENVYIFIDSQNLNLSIRDQGWKLDFKIFYKYLKTKFNAEKIFLFLGYISKNKNLYSFLQDCGYEIIFKPVINYKNNKIEFIKGNIDAELVLHSMIEYNNYTKFIIISGDGDFYCLIEYLNKKNKLKNIIIPNKNRYSSLLRKYRKYFFYIDNLKNKLEKWNKKEAE